MGEDKKEDDKKVTLTPYETYCTDFLSKISLICMFAFIVMVMVFIFLLSKNTLDPETALTLTYPEFIFMIFICLSLIASTFLIIPVIFQMMIYMVEDLPDNKIPVKRGVNRFILGLSIFTLIILCMVLPAIYQSNQVWQLLLFIVSLLFDIASTIIKLVYKPDLSFNILVPVVMISSIFVLFANHDPITVLIIFLTKIAILFSMNFISQFKSVEDGKKKNIMVLSMTIIVSLNCIVLYFIFKDSVNDYISSTGTALVNQFYGFISKLLTENPLKLAKLLPSP